MKVSEIAARIDSHLERMEKSEQINKKTGRGMSWLYQSGAIASGRWVCITYVSYQGDHCLSKTEAEKYLSALDSGKNIKHWDINRESEEGK